MISLSYIMDLYAKWISTLSDVWTFFTTPFSNSLESIDTGLFFDFPIVHAMFLFLKGLNFSPIELMLSGLLIFYIVY